MTGAALFSGGRDSLVSTHKAITKGLADRVVHCYTGSGLPENIQWIRDVCEEFGWPLDGGSAMGDNETVYINDNPIGETEVYHADRHYVTTVHRLAAVAWFGFDKVVDKVVHHSNGFKLDNRESNLDVTSPVRHGRVSASVK